MKEILFVIVMLAILKLILSISFELFNFIDTTLTRAIESLYRQYEIECIRTDKERSYRLVSVSYGMNKKHALAKFYKTYGSKYKVKNISRI